MTNRPTIKEIKDSVDIVDVISRFTTLKKEGQHYKGKCIFHDDKHASLVVTPAKNIWKCFVCDGKGVRSGGDVVDFVIATGKNYQEALFYLQDPHNNAAVVPGQKNKSKAKKHPVIQWDQILPTKDTPPPDTTHYTYGKPVKTWVYKTITGDIHGFVCRFDTTDGKQVLPFVYAESKELKRKEWRWLGFGKPRPLYNLDLINADKKKTVIISEGEKTADAVTYLVNTALSTTWIGGARAIQHTDWSPLYGRKIILWPDNDAPGIEAMLAIYEILKDHCKIIKWVKNPSDVPTHWDAADSLWTPEFGRQFVKDNIVDVPSDIKLLQQQVAADTQQQPTELELQQLNSQQPPPHQHHFIDVHLMGPVDPPVTNENNGEPDSLMNNPHFKILGYEKEGHSNLYHFYSYGSKCIISLPPTSMSKPNLMQLAPLNWWEMNFESKKTSFNVDMAQNFLISASTTARVFTEKWIRGRGAWVDGKSIVIHTGDKLIVNGKANELNKFKSRYIYEIGEELGFNTEFPLDDVNAYKFIDICKLLNWERDINAYLLAGWCVIAPICGALDWRPHIWLTGASGTGKSWVFRNVVRMMLGETAIALQGETSEAGVRQTLKHDALPVIFDEAEGNDRKSQERMQDVLSLMRQASTSDGGKIAKGTATGSAKTFRTRSCFAFASISVQVTHQSDITRVSILSLKKDNNRQSAAEKWKKLQESYLQLITDEYAARLRARTVAILPIILKNAKTFASAAAVELGEQRAGDQIGALLAGAYSLRSTAEITFEKAIEFIKSKDWSEEKGQDKTKDEVALIAHLMDQIIRVETNYVVQERSLGELIQIAHGLISDEVITVTFANDRLLRLGFKIDSNYLVISNSAVTVKNMLRETAWARNHNKILMRLETAEAVESTRFASGVLTRAVKMKITAIFKDLGKI
jgi:putative DNA primase/helicase